MTADIILFPNCPDPADTPEPPKPLYELRWTMTDGTAMIISSRDPDRILRQMEHLARRGAQASVYADGWWCGGVCEGCAGQPPVLSFNPRRA